MWLVQTRIREPLALRMLLALAWAWRDWGRRGILFVESFMLYKLICYGTSVKEPWQDEQKNGAQKGWARVSIPYQLQPSPSAGVNGLRPRTWFYEWPQAGSLIGAEGTCVQVAWLEPVGLPPACPVWWEAALGPRPWGGGACPGSSELGDQYPCGSSWAFPLSLHRGRLDQITKASHLLPVRRRDTARGLWLASRKAALGWGLFSGKEAPSAVSLALETPGSVPRMCLHVASPQKRNVAPGLGLETLHFSFPLPGCLTFGQRILSGRLCSFWKKRGCWGLLEPPYRLASPPILVSLDWFHP